jgi:alpha-1,2-mannosyltransferase
MIAPERAGWPPLRTAFWVLVTLAVLVVFGTNFVRSFRPRVGIEKVHIVDFAQEWLSAKNYEARLPVYSDQQEALRRYLDVTRLDSELIIRYNAHPPVAVLLTLPLGKLSYPDAMLVWNLATFVLFLVAVALVVRELRMPFTGLSLLPATALIVGGFPVFFQVAEGQLNCLLAFLLTVGWVADRRGFQAAAGVAVGAAAAIKLTPLFLLVYFVAARRWRGAVALVAAFLALNGAAVAVLGIDAFRFYVTDVVPSVAERFQTSSRNSAIAGFWLRLFAPHPEVRMLALAREPLVATIVAGILRAIVVVLTTWLTWRADSVESRDRAFAVALVAMLLVAPLTWAHYFLLLLLPVGLVWMRTPGVLPRLFMWLVFVVLLLPDNIGVIAALGWKEGKLVGTEEQRMLTGVEGLYTVSLPHYALEGLFLLTLLAPRTEPVPGSGYDRHRRAGGRPA